MKRLVTGLLLASVLLVAGVVSASAVSIYQNKNATLLFNDAGSSAWLFLINASPAAVNEFSVLLAAPASIDAANSYVYKAENGKLVPFGLTTGDVETMYWTTKYGGRTVRLWLPAEVAPYDFIVVKIDRVGTTPIQITDAYFVAE